MFCSFLVDISAIQFIQTVYNVSFTRMPLLLAGNGFRNLLKIGYLFFTMNLLCLLIEVLKSILFFCRFQLLVCYF